MKKRLTFITFLMLFCSTIFGQSHWEMTQEEIDSYQDAQTLCLSVQINNVDIEEEGLEIAAFHNNTLRGVATTKYFKPKNTYYANIKVYGTTLSETISFRLYDTTGEEAKELSSDYTIDWNPDNTLGSPATPISVNFYEKHWEDNSGSFQFSMTIVCTIEIDNVIQQRSDLELAAFYGEELRGSTRVERMGETDFYVASLPVGGNTNYESISFKLYDPIIDLELNTDYTVSFIADSQIGEEEPFSMEFFTPVAKVGETYYTTLEAAVQAAGTGEMGTTITLLKDAEGSGVIINKSLTIDFNGKTYTFTSPAVGSNGTPTQGFQILKDNTVTLQNGTLNVAEAARTDFAMLIQNYANLTITDMILNGDNLDRYTIKDYDYSYVLSNNCGEVNIGGNTQILANPGAVEGDGHYGVAFDACKYANYSAPVVTLGEEVVIDGKVELSGGELYTSQEIDIVVKKEFKAGADWGTISVPVVEASIPEATAGIHDLYRYDEPSATWQYYKDGVNGGNAENPFATLKLGQGYLYANAEDIELVLEGKLNFADVVFPLSYTEDNNLAGFNMVGNPFAYSIGLGNFATEASLADGFYTIGAGGAWIAQTEGQKIAPMEAVLVKADQAANMTIKAGQQQGTKRNQPKAYLAINVANSEFEDVAYVSFSEGMGLDKISHRNADVPMVSVPVDGKEYAIAIMNEDVTEIPVTFKASTIGEYTFSAEGIECEFSKLTLVDRQTGNTTNLLLEDYTFMATSNDNVNRFFLQIDNSQPSTDSSDFAYINNGMIKIDNIEGNGVVRVLDVLGRPVAEYDVQETANIPTASFANGVYMIQMMDNNGVKVQKIIID